MNVYRILNVAALVLALALGIWYANGPLPTPFFRLVGAGSALGLLLVIVFPLPRMTSRQHVTLLGVGFLLLALGSPAAWLLGLFAGLGGVLLWKAYQASSSNAKA